MEFQSKLSAEQIKSRLEARTAPLPSFKPPWDQILCRQKRERFTLFLRSGLLHYATFTGKLREQERGCLIKGRFHQNPVLEFFLLVVITFGVQEIFHLLFSWAVDYTQTWIGILVASVIYIATRYVSREQQQKLLDFIQNNLLE